jgi:hypothetical protein
MNKFLVLILLTSTASFACDPVKYVEKGQPAPCTGYVFTPDKEKEVRLKVVELDFYKDLVTLKERQLVAIKEENDIITKRYDLWKKESDSLSRDLSKERSNNFWRTSLYFVLGAAVTTGITYAVRR